MRAVLLTFVLLTVGFAGCTGQGPPMADEVVVLSGDPSPTPPPTAKPGKGLGHIVGHIVDDRLHPIAGATATIAALDLVDVADRTGQFDFVDVVPGQYLLKFNASGHQEASAVLAVKADEFTRVRVVLQPTPPAEPYVELIKHKGHVWTTDPEGLGFVTIGTVSFPFEADRRGLEDVVVEAFMDPNPGGRNGFDVRLVARACCNTYWGADLPNPFWGRIPLDNLADEELVLRAYPWSNPVPEAQKDFEVIVSLFYHAPAPPGYTVAG